MSNYYEQLKQQNSRNEARILNISNGIVYFQDPTQRSQTDINSFISMIETESGYRYHFANISELSSKISDKELYLHIKTCNMYRTAYILGLSSDNETVYFEYGVHKKHSMPVKEFVNGIMNKGVHSENISELERVFTEPNKCKIQGNTFIIPTSIRKLFPLLRKAYRDFIAYGEFGRPTKELLACQSHPCNSIDDMARLKPELLQKMFNINSIPIYTPRYVAKDNYNFEDSMVPPEYRKDWEEVEYRSRVVIVDDNGRIGIPRGAEAPFVHKGRTGVSEEDLSKIDFKNVIQWVKLEDLLKKEGYQL